MITFPSPPLYITYPPVLRHPLPPASPLNPTIPVRCASRKGDILVYMNLLYSECMVCRSRFPLSPAFTLLLIKTLVCRNQELLQNVQLAASPLTSSGFVAIRVWRKLTISFFSRMLKISIIIFQQI